MGHAGEHFSHGANVGGAGEGEAAADKSGEGEKPGGDGDAEHDAGENQEAGDETDLALESPSGDGAADRGIAGADPFGRAGNQNGEIGEFRLEEGSGEAGAGAGLADENDGTGAVEIGGAEFDLVEGDVGGSGEMAAGELGCGADVDELRGVAG